MVDVKKLVVLALGFCLFGCEFELTKEIPNKQFVFTSPENKLVFVSPSNNSVDVSGKTPVTFMWDKPTFVLQNAERTQKWLSRNISVMPAMKGSWQVLGTTGILFEPKENWKNSTRYEFRISEEVVGEVVEYAFETPRVKLERVDANDLIFRKPLLVRLNQDISLKEAKKFWVRADTKVFEKHVFSKNEEREVDASVLHFDVKYHVVKTKNKKGKLIEKKDKSIVEFIPKEDWPEGMRYTLGIPKEIRGLEGTLSTLSEQARGFSTILSFTITKHSIQDVLSSFDVSFSSPVPINNFWDNVDLDVVDGAEWDRYVEQEKQESMERRGENYSSRYFYIQSLGAHWVPQKKYTLTVNKDLKDKYGRRLGKDEVISFSSEFSNTVRSVFFPREVKTYKTGILPKYYIWYSGAHNNVSLKIERVPPKNGEVDKNIFKKNLVWDAHPDKRQVVEFDFAKEFPELVDENDLLVPGWYKVQLFYTPDERDARQHTITSEFGVLDFQVELKQTANDEIIVYPEILKEGQRFDVDIFEKYWKQDCNCRVVEHKISHEDVTVPFKFPINTNKKNIIFVRSGNQVGIGSTEFEKGIRPYDAPVLFQPYKYKEFLTGVVFPDRPLFRPGDKVFFKSLFRERLFFEKQFPLKSVNSNKNYSYRIKISDPQYNEIYSEEFKTKGGSLDGEWVIPGNGILGKYQLTVEFLYADGSIMSEKGTDFYVTEYRKPTFLIDAEFDTPQAVWKDEILAEVSAEYAFGGKMAGKKVNYQVSFFGRERQHWYWHGGAKRDRVLAEGESVLDADGMLRIPVVLDVELEDEIDWDLVNLGVTVEASPSEKSSKTISIPFYRSSEKIQLEQGRYFYRPENEKIEVSGEVTDLDDHPLEDKEISVELFQKKWVRSDRRSGNGDFVGEWQSEEVLIHDEEIESDEHGAFETSLKIPEESGQYFVRVFSEDEKDRLAKAERHFWVWTDKHAQFSMRQNEVNRILPLFTDKDDYKVGDDIEVLFPHDEWKIEKVHATIERGTVLEMLEVNLENNTVGFKAEAWMAPNIFASVLIEGKDKRGVPQVRWGVIKISVSDASHALSIKLTPDKKNYRPQDTVLLDIFTESNGNSISSEVTIAVVDQTLLALKSRPELDLWKKFLAELPLGVRTFHSLANFLSEIDLGDIYKKVEKIKAASESPFGGGGGGGKGGEFKPRGDFRDTAAFIATIQTDENGHAVAKIPLPDNLTKWHIWAVGSTKGNAFGEAETELQTSLPILISPIVPNFFRAGDKTNVGLLIRRNISDPKEEEIKITMQIPEEIEGDVLEESVDVMDEERVFFPVSVPYEKKSIPVDGLDIELRFDIEGLESGLKDSIVLKRKILPPVISTSVAEFLKIKEPTDLTFRTDERSLKSVLVVKIFGTLIDRLQKFVDIAHEMNLLCTEQQFSYWTSRILQYQLFSSFGKDVDLINKEELENVKTVILKAQGGSGGFRFWPNSWYESVWLTAHILEFADLWKEFGITLPKEDLEKSSQWLRNQVFASCAKRCISDATRQYAAFVLIKRGVLSAMDLDFLSAHLHSEEAKAWWVRSVYFAENIENNLSPNVRKRGKEIAEELQRLMKFRDRYAFWEESNRSFYSQNERLTAILFEWIVENKILESAQPKIARYLADTKSRLSGNSALRVLIALKKYSQIIPEDNWPVHFSVENINEVGDDDVQGALDSKIDKFEVKKFLPKNIEKTISFNSSNKKQFYTDVELYEVFQASDLSATQKGFWIEREIFEVEDRDFENSVTKLEVGKAYLVRVKVVTNASHRQVVVEDSVPSGAEGVNFDLENVDHDLRQFTDSDEDDICYGWCQPRVEHKEFYFDKTRFFIPEMRAGTHEFKYLIQTMLEGAYELLPPKVSEMYYPEVYATGEGKIIEIQR